MASQGIRDRVAIVGMGCTPFGERWDKGPDDLLVDAATEALNPAGAGKRQIASVARGRRLALTHNLGGAPGECVSFVSVVGSEPSA